ncbi:MAG: PAS domain S-box protein [Bacteroidota bacterium]|nr:PAS domain S-box protein [Bacteroidota bacterium]
MTSYSSKTKAELIAEIKRLQSAAGSSLKQAKKDPASGLVETFARDIFIQNSHNTILLVDRKGLILDINRLETMDKKLVQGKPAGSFVDKESRLVLKAAIDKTFKTGKSQVYFTQRTTPQGITHYKSKASPFRENRKIVAVMIDVIDITSEVRAQEELSISEQRFRALAHNASDVVFRYQVHPEFKQEFISPSIKKLSGYSSEEYYKDPFLGVKIIHPDDQHIVMASNIKAINGEPFILRWVHKKGHIVWTETINTPVKDAKGTLIAYEGITRDISSRKLTELALLDSEKSLAQVLSNINELVYFIDFLPNGKKRIKYLGEQIESLLGVTRQEYEKEGKKLLSLCHPDDVEKIMESAAKLKSTKKAQEFVYRVFHRKKKEYIWVQEKITPQIDSEGNYTGNFGITRDVTEQVKYEQQLKEEKLKAQNYLDVAGVVLVLLDRKCHVQLINKMGCELLGYREKDILNKNWFEFIPIEVRSKMKKVFTRIMNGEIVEDDFTNSEIITKKGKRRTINWKSSLISDESGRITSMLSSGEDITDKLIAEKALRDSEEKFRMLAENASDVVYRFSIFPENKYEYVSPSIYQMTGYTPEEYYKNPHLSFKIVHPADVHLLGNTEKILKEKSSVSNIKAPSIVLRWVKKDGSIIWTETRNKPLFNSKGKLIAIEGISRDITQQKKSEEELKDSEERFRILSNATFEGIVFSENGKIIDANDQFTRMFGYSSVGEYIGMDIIADFVIPEQRSLARRLIRLSKSEPFEVQAMTNDGNLITIEAKGQNIPYFGRNIRATVIYNITERKQYEYSLRESERTLSTLMNNLPGMAYRCDYDSQWSMRFVSNGFQELTGYSPKDIINNKKRSFADIIHPKDRNLGKKEIEEAIRDQTPFEIEYRLITASGKEKWVWEKGEGVFSDEGKLLFLEGFITDVDDKKQFELELKRSRLNYKSLIDNSPTGVLIYRNSKLEFANPSALKMVEADSIEQIFHMPSSEFLLPECREQAMERVLRAQKGEDLPFREIRMKTLKGNIIEVEAKPVAIKYNGEDAIQVVFSDVTAPKQLIREQLRVQVAEETNQKLQLEISERLNAERTLLQTQKYTRLLIDSSLDMICASDKEGFITEFNAAAQSTFGYTSEEMIGKHVSLLYADPEARKRINEEELYTNGKYAGEVVNLKKNGERFVAYLSASVLRDDAGNVVGAMGVSRDISELKRAEEELKISEGKYRAIYDQAYIGIARVGLKEGDFIEVNQRLCDILGYNSEELCKMTTWQITHPEDLNTKLPERKEFLKSNASVLSTEKRYIHKDGTVVYANLTITLVKDVAGVPQYFVSVYEDITERKKADEKLKVQSAKHNAIIESSSHIIWTVDTNLCLTSFNKNFTSYLKKHYDVDAQIGLSVVAGKVISTEEYNNYWKKKYLATLKGEHQYFETKMVDLQNNLVWREIFLNPIFDEAGAVVEVAGIGHDITEKKLANEQIHQSLQEKEVLLKEVHHRVKNNLQVISSILNLQSSYVKDPSTLNILKESQNRIKSMAFIHESLYQTKDFSSINFSEYVINLSQNLLHSYSGLEHEIKLNLDIQNVFLNLDLAIPCGLIINEIVSNALKYAFVDKKDNGAITIIIVLKGEDLHLKIGDNGIGLPKSIDYRNTESLGLQLVVTLVDQLNGVIELNTEKGTEYNVVFKQNQVKNRI